MTPREADRVDRPRALLALPLDGWANPVAVVRLVALVVALVT